MIVIRSSLSNPVLQFVVVCVGESFIQEPQLKLKIWLGGWNVFLKYFSFVTAGLYLGKFWLRN